MTASTLLLQNFYGTGSKIEVELILTDRLKVVAEKIQTASVSATMIRYPFDWVLIFTFHLLANGLMLLNNGVFWDDWTLFNMSFAGIREQYVGNGLWNTGIGWLYYYLTLLPNAVLWFKLISFGLYLISALLFYRILQQLFPRSRSTALYVVIFFIALPFNMAKVTMICLGFALKLCLFLLAYNGLIAHLRNSNILLRFGVLLLFTYSFTTNSLLVFYAIVPFTIYLLKIKNKKLDGAKIIIQYIDFLLLPIAFWIFRLCFLMPSAYYAESGYNTLSLYRLLVAPLRAMQSVQDTIYGLIAAFKADSLLQFGFGFIVITLLFTVARRANYRLITPYRMDYFLVLGISLFLLAITPYVLVGKVPGFIGYDTRHQLLMPFGTAIILVAGSILILRKKWVVSVLLTFILVFTTTTIKQHLAFIRQWLKQEAVMISLAEHPEWGNAKNIILQDHTPDYNATDRSTGFYEWNGMAKYVYKTQDRLFLTEDLLDEVQSRYGSLTNFVQERRQLKVLESRSMRDYQPAYSCIKIVIRETEYSLRKPLHILHLTATYYLDITTFWKKIGKYIHLSSTIDCEIPQYDTSIR